MGGESVNLTLPQWTIAVPQIQKCHLGLDCCGMSRFVFLTGTIPCQACSNHQKALIAKLVGYQDNAR
jgi:hypothetical protein